MAKQNINRRVENAFSLRWTAACVWGWEMGLVAGVGTARLLFQHLSAIGFGTDSAFWIVWTLFIIPASNSVMWIVGGMAMGFFQKLALQEYGARAVRYISEESAQRSVLNHCQTWAKYWTGISVGGAIVAAVLTTGTMMLTARLFLFAFSLLFLPAVGAVAGVMFGAAQWVVFQFGNRQLARWLLLHAFGGVLIMIASQVLAIGAIEPADISLPLKTTSELLIMAGLITGVVAAVYGEVSGGVVVQLLRSANAQPD